MTTHELEVLKVSNSTPNIELMICEKHSCIKTIKTWVCGGRNCTQIFCKECRKEYKTKLSQQKQDYYDKNKKVLDLKNKEYYKKNLKSISELPYTSMTDDNFKKCWSLNNLRPYSAKQNILDGLTKIRHNFIAGGTHENI